MPSRAALCLLAFVLSFASLATAVEPVPLGKLPRDAVPEHYALDLTVDPHAERFSGMAAIRVRLARASRTIWLHGKQLEVTKVEALGADGKSVAGRYVAAAPQEGVARVDFDRDLAAGKWTLTFAYSAPFNRQLEGLYKAEHAGQPYIVTQMEPISARLAFPGFDEPAFKTPFDLVLRIPATQKAVANTTEASRETLAGGGQKITFRTTPPLPTYLVAFGVGPWDIVDGPTIPASAWRKEAVPLRGVAAAGEGKRLREALDATPGIVAALEDYFGYPYAFGKLDLLAAPDFSVGAMENPGLIVFRDWLLLLDANSPTSFRRHSFDTNAHELAHQWFGDTVTMPWWDDLWLNEAFATWMQERITQKLRPAYRADLDRIEGAQGAMQADSLASARRIRQPIGDNGDIEGAFDGLTYSKGAAVLGMFEAWLGEDTFRKGIRAHVAGHAFASATADDLIDALAKAGDQGPRFGKAMRSFLDQPGVPLVETTLQCRDGQASLHARQQRYFPVGSAGDAAQTWGIPVCVRLGRGGRTDVQCRLFDSTEADLPLDGGCPDWYLPNADARGYYRFTMPAADLARLTAAIATQGDRDQLAYADAIAAGFEHGSLDAPAVLSAMERLAASPTRQVATALIPEFRWIRRQLADAETARALDAFATRLYLPRLTRLGYVKRASEAEDDALLRAELVDFLALRVRVPEVRQTLLAQARRVLEPGRDGHLRFTEANSDLFGSTLAVAVQELGAAAMDTLIAEIGRQSDPMLRASMIAALGAATEPKLAERAREFALGDAVKVGEVARLLGVNRALPENADAYWTWFQRRFEAVVARTPTFARGDLPETVVDDACSVDRARAIETFFAPHLDTLTGARQGLGRALESIELCRRLREQQGVQALVDWARTRH